MYQFLGLSKYQWEIVYYVFFVILTIILVVLTFGLVIFAIKTYFFQTEKRTELFCKCIESECVEGHSDVSLEIYNNGNIVSKNIKVKIQDKNYGMIPFLKPNESYTVRFSHIIYELGGRKIFVNSLEESKIKVTLDIDGKIQSEEIDISILLEEANSYKVRATAIMSEVDSHNIREIATNSGRIVEAIERLGTFGIYLRR